MVKFSFRPVVLAISACAVFSPFEFIHARVVRHKFTLTWEVGAPNGIAREMIKINGGFPGPNIIADQGDDVEIIVHNKMPFNTTVHWHGIEQRGTPWSDGTPGLTQYPIEPGETYKYYWNANTYGTYWYHAHSRGTLADGLYGAIYIRPKKDQPRPYHLISKDEKDINAMREADKNPYLVLVSDWTNFTFHEYMEAAKKSGMALFCTDSILTNGKGDQYCPPVEYLNSLLIPALAGTLDESPLTDKGCFPPVPAVQGEFPFDESLVPYGLQRGCRESRGGREVFKVDNCNEWASFNFICATSLKSLQLSIDEHEMWIYAADGHYIEPQLADTMIMFNGERYSAMVRLNKKPGNYTMRIAGSGRDQVISGYAEMHYVNAPPEGLGRESIPSINYGGQPVVPTVRNLDVTKLTPFYGDGLPYISNKTAAIHFLNVGRLGAVWKWTMDGKKLYESDRSAYNPLIFYPNHPDTLDQDLVLRQKNDTWIDFIVQVGTNPKQLSQFPHSMHKHGNRMYRIGQGLGYFNWTTVEEAVAERPEMFNLINPPYRDTFMTSFQGPNWIAIRYHVAIPGPFMFHCHIETHLEGGMAIVLMDGVDKWPVVPEEYRGGKVMEEEDD